MKLIIQNSSACSETDPVFKIYTDAPNHLLITCPEQPVLRRICDEFGLNSKNYAPYAPRFFGTQTATGSGKFLVASPVYPYLLDKNKRFTTIDADGATVGGIFINQKELSTIRSFLTATFPGLTIDDRRFGSIPSSFASISSSFAMY